MNPFERGRYLQARNATLTELGEEKDCDSDPHSAFALAIMPLGQPN